jgi:diguanylate cyclase (GGDEF)-like protein
MYKKQTWPLLSLVGLLWGIYCVTAITRTGWLGDIVSPLISWVVAAFLAISSRKRHRSTLVWSSLTLGTVFWALSETLWGIYANVLGIDPGKNVLLEYLYLATNLFYLVGVALFAFRERRRWISRQFVVDAAGILFALCAFVYFTLMRIPADHAPLGIHAILSSYLALASDMILFSLSVSVYLSINPRRIPLYLTLAFFGIVFFAMADILYAYSLFSAAYYPNEAVDVLYMLAIGMLGAASALYLDHPKDPVIAKPEIDTSIAMINRSLFLLLVPTLAVLVRGLSGYGIAVLVVIVLIHQVITRFNGRLRRFDLALEDKARQTGMLEATIADRTRELRIMNQTLENLLKRDAITGLFNRKYFLETTDEWIAGGSKDDRIWLLILDFDRFKTINDAYGHDAGDHVLRIVAKRLEATANDRTVIARLGGDEFGVVCKRREGETITALLRTIKDLASEPVQVTHNSVHASLSIGVASWPEDALSRSDLMRHADMAMYIAKRRKLNGVSFFDNALIAGIERTHQIDFALRDADFDREFSLVYQPQFATGGRRLIGMEALVRWRSSALGPVAPDEFIPVAEENGVINPLSDWICKKALARIADWNLRYGRNLLMGINVSPHQLDDPGFLAKLVAIMDESRVSPAWVNLEFTERIAMKDEAFIVEIFSSLSRLNVTSSIDDFGTGYSSLSYIKKFDIDYLKIAKQLVDNIVQNETDERIVQAIIMMATALNIRTIAEGVETEDQLAILERLGCDEIQGYLLGKPCPEAEFEERFLKGDEPELLEKEED